MKRWALAFVAVCLAAVPARGDIVVYTVPGLGGLVTVTLEGTMKDLPVLSGGQPLISFNSPATGVLRMKKSEVSRSIKCPTTKQLFAKKLNQAKGDAVKLMEVAEWALKHGMLEKFRECVKAAYTLDATNAEAKRLTDLMQEIDTIDLGESTELESFLRNRVGSAKNMEFRKSKHFILYHNTNKGGKDGKPAGPKKGDRAEQRLALLEKVYESFLFKFYSKGIKLDIPKERLMVVLFEEEKQFLNYAEMVSPSLKGVAGFWSHVDNIAVFYDHGGTEEFKSLQELNRALQDQKQEAYRLQRAGIGGDNADIVHRAEAIDKIFNMWQQNQDITVVSHECVHQMAGNTGLLPRHVMVPSWVHEGLATYFECPKDASWSGIGAVNEERLEWYRALERGQKEVSSLEWIVSDQIFDLAATHAGRLHAYGQAWALTHFMLEEHPLEMLAFYDRLGKMPPDVIFSPEVLHKTFDEAVKIDRDKLTRDWRNYMDDLKTDVDLMMEEADGSED